MDTSQVPATTVFAHNKEGHLLSPSGHDTSDIIYQDRVAVPLAFMLGFYLCCVGAARDFNPYLCWSLVTPVTLYAMIGLRINRHRTVRHDLAKHGYPTVADYRHAANTATQNRPED